MKKPRKSKTLDMSHEMAGFVYPPITEHDIEHSIESDIDFSEHQEIIPAITEGLGYDA